MEKLFYITFAAFFTILNAQEIIKDYEAPAWNIDYPSSNFLTSGSKILHANTSNATECAKWCNTLVDKGLTLTPCVAFVFSNATYELPSNETLPAKTCIPKSSTKPRIERDGRYYIYSYVKSSMAPSITPRIMMLFAATSTAFFLQP